MEPFWIDPVTEREERRLRRMAIKCFNCGDYHHLDDCPMVSIVDVGRSTFVNICGMLCNFVLHPYIRHTSYS